MRSGVNEAVRLGVGVVGSESGEGGRRGEGDRGGRGIVCFDMVDISLP